MSAGTAIATGGNGGAVKAVILAGGFGTRLAEETSLKPKPMIEIGGRPILWHIMKIYSAARRQRLRDLLRLQGLRDQGVLRQLLPAHVRRHLRHGQEHDGGAPEERRAVAGHARRHRRGLDDRRAPEARRRLPAGRRRASASPTATASPTSTSRPRSPFIAATASWRRSPPCSRPAATARSRLDGAQRARLHREAARRRRPDQRRLLRALAGAASTTSRATRPAGRASRWRGLAARRRADGLRPHRLLAADGHAARQEPARRALAIGPGALEDAGEGGDRCRPSGAAGASC